MRQSMLARGALIGGGVVLGSSLVAASMIGAKRSMAAGSYQNFNPQFFSGNNLLNGGFNMGTPLGGIGQPINRVGTGQEAYPGYSKPSGVPQPAPVSPAPDVPNQEQTPPISLDARNVSVPVQYTFPPAQADAALPKKSHANHAKPQKLQATHLPNTDYADTGFY